MRIILRIWRRFITNDWWRPRRCLWPYHGGWCAYNTKRRTFLDVGLTRDQIVSICKELNQ